MIVKGYRRKTVALPFFKSNRARRGVVGANGFLVVSKTATLIFKKKSFDFGMTSLSRNVRLDNDLVRFECLRHWLGVDRLFNHKPQSLGLAPHRLNELSSFKPG